MKTNLLTTIGAIALISMAFTTTNASARDTRLKWDESGSYQNSGHKKNSSQHHNNGSSTSGKKGRKSSSCSPYDPNCNGSHCQTSNTCNKGCDNSCDSQGYPNKGGKGSKGSKGGKGGKGGMNGQTQNGPKPTGGKGSKGGMNGQNKPTQTGNKGGKGGMGGKGGKKGQGQKPQF